MPAIKVPVSSKYASHHGERLPKRQRVSQAGQHPLDMSCTGNTSTASSGNTDDGAVLRELGVIKGMMSKVITELASVSARLARFEKTSCAQAKKDIADIKRSVHMVTEQIPVVVKAEARVKSEQPARRPVAVNRGVPLTTANMAAHNKAYSRQACDLDSSDSELDMWTM